MAVKAYVLIETQVGKTGDVINGTQKIKGVKSADSVAGAYDVVATVEVADLDALGNLVKQVHSVSGVAKTTTLIAVKYQLVKTQSDAQKSNDSRNCQSVQQEWMSKDGQRTEMAKKEDEQKAP